MNNGEMITGHIKKLTGDELWRINVISGISCGRMHTADFSHLPFFVMIISVPTELNCFHREEFSSSIFTSSLWGLEAGSQGTEGGASILGAMSQVGGNSGMWAGASLSVWMSKSSKLNINDENRSNMVHTRFMQLCTFKSIFLYINGFFCFVWMKYVHWCPENCH